MLRVRCILILSGMLICSPHVAQAGSQTPGYWIEGPVTADVIRVLDGDTVEVRAYPWPQQSITVKVRLRGIDAPEIHSRCDMEKKQGLEALNALANMLGKISSVRLTNISGGKYYGRILANMEVSRGRDASAAMLDSGLVRRYSGGKKPKVMCP